MEDADVDDNDAAGESATCTGCDSWGGGKRGVSAKTSRPLVCEGMRVAVLL